MSWNVLVTGAAGFIGSHVAKKLATYGHHVVGVDNFCPYYDLQLKKDRAAELKNHKIEIHYLDVEQEKELKALVEKEKITHIVHLAAQAGVRYSLQEPRAYLRSNIDGFLSILEIARAFPSIVTVYASSSSVYGTNTKLPFSEEDTTDHPANLYGATKKANEVMAYSYHHLFGLKLIGLRFFTVYGPWGRPDMAYYLFADKIMRQEKIELFGGGTLRRDFTYIDDIVDGIIAALQAPRPFALYNLGNSSTESVSTLVALLEKFLGKKAVISLSECQKGDMIDTFADVSLAKKELGFSPKTSLSEGILRFVSWYKEYTSKNILK